ncbi:MAG TPA: protein kinase [Kofleriaceae bacterium]
MERRDPLLGQVFDRRFRIDAKIAAGGFGAIYRVTRLRDGEELALKVLHPNLTSDPGVVARFRREGAAMTRLRDPNTIIAYELGEAQDGTLYILMELLRGGSLYERFRVQGALPWRPVLALARAVCSSLAEAHGLGIIHRDLKPTNIHLEPGADDIEFVKVLDFGIAKILEGSDLDPSELTHAGQMIGTLDYMSPEQMVGGQCGPSSDLYTLGLVMYEMIAGVKPFDGTNSPASALATVLTTTPVRLGTRAVVPVDVDRIIMRCLAREAEDRFQTADELAAAIDEVLDTDEQVTSIAPRIAAVAVAHGGRTGVAMPRILTPAPPTLPKDRTPPSALPSPQLESTLVGHEPVARLPAGPLRKDDSGEAAPVGRASQPRFEPPRRPSQPVLPHGFASPMIPTTPGAGLRRMPEPTGTEDSIDSAAAILEQSQDGATKLHRRADDPAAAKLAALPALASRPPAVAKPVASLKVTPPPRPVSALAATVSVHDEVTSDSAAASGTINTDATIDSSAAGDSDDTDDEGRPAEPRPVRKPFAARLTPPAGVPSRPAAQVPTNLREAYPRLQLHPPSPTRPAAGPDPFEDRPATGVRSPIADASAPNPFEDRFITGVRSKASVYPRARRLPLGWIALVLIVLGMLAVAWALIQG